MKKKKERERSPTEAKCKQSNKTKQQCIAFLWDNADSRKLRATHFPKLHSSIIARKRKEDSNNAKRVPSVSRIWGRTEVILGARQYHMWFDSIPSGTSQVHGMTSRFPSRLPGGAAFVSHPLFWAITLISFCYRRSPVNASTSTVFILRLLHTQVCASMRKDIWQFYIPHLGAQWWLIWC